MSIQKFAQLQKQIMNLAEKEHFDEALSIIERAKIEFPEKLDRLGHWKAQVYCLLGEDENALAELNEVLNKGLWWNPIILLNDSELEQLKELRAFKMIIEKCEELYNLQKHSTKPYLHVEGNRDAKTSIFSLHWKGSNVKDFSEQIGDKDLLKDVFMGFPQSSQLFSHECYSWDDSNTAKKDILDTFKKFDNMYEVNEKVNIISGASQGGKVAVEMSLDESILQFSKFIAVVPAFDVSLIEDIIRTNTVSNVRGCIITGDQDPFYEKALEVVAILEKHRIPCKLIVQKGMGHSIPDHFAQIFQEAIDFVMNVETT